MLYWKDLPYNYRGNKMKRLISIIFIGVLILSTVSCSDKEIEDSNFSFMNLFMLAVQGDLRNQIEDKYGFGNISETIADVDEIVKLPESEEEQKGVSSTISVSVSISDGVNNTSSPPFAGSQVRSTGRSVIKKALQKFVLEKVTGMVKQSTAVSRGSTSATYDVSDIVSTMECHNNEDSGDGSSYTIEGLDGSITATYDDISTDDYYIGYKSYYDLEYDNLTIRFTNCLVDSPDFSQWESFGDDPDTWPFASATIDGTFEINGMVETNFKINDWTNSDTDDSHRYEVIVNLQNHLTSSSEDLLVNGGDPSSIYVDDESVVAFKLIDEYDATTSTSNHTESLDGYYDFRGKINGNSYTIVLNFLSEQQDDNSSNSPEAVYRYSCDYGVTDYYCVNTYMDDQSWSNFDMSSTQTECEANSGIFTEAMKCYKTSSLGEDPLGTCSTEYFSIDSAQKIEYVYYESYLVVNGINPETDECTGSEQFWNSTYTP